MKIIAVIPARYGSTRFPGKPLASICGKPMIQWVYENARQCSLLDSVVVATDSDEIARATKGFGGQVCMTSDKHQTGTDRIAEVAGHSDADVIVNVQGDEPLLQPQAIEEALRPLIARQDIPMGTLKTRIKTSQDIDNPNVVKVVTDMQDRALYFSRSAVPFVRNRARDFSHYRHIGLYVYRRDFLLHLSSMPQSSLERTESLEQLRALEYGFHIHVAATDYDPVGVDAPDDVCKVEKIVRESTGIVR